MSKLFILVILGVILVCALGICFIHAYDEEMRNVEDAIKRAGDNDPLF
jgi:hypothetical protein